MYEVIISSEFSKQFYHLPKKIQDRARKILSELEKRLKGYKLKGDLLGFYSVHFERNKYRLIYYKEENTIKILAVQVGLRKKNFYKDFKKYLKQHPIGY